MKKIFLLLLLILGLVIPGQAQHKSAAFVGLQHQLSLQRLTFRLSIAPMGGLQYHRHLFSGGPILLLKEFNATNDHFPKLTGLQLTYQYLLSANTSKKVRFFAEINSRGQQFRESWYSNYWEESLQQYRDIKQESRETLIENYAGLGMQYQLHPRLYAQASGAIGYSFSKLERTGDSPVSTENNLDYRAYENRDLCYAVNLGLTFKIGK